MHSYGFMQCVFKNIKVQFLKYSIHCALFRYRWFWDIGSGLSPWTVSMCSCGDYFMTKDAGNENLLYLIQDFKFEVKNIFQRFIELPSKLLLQWKCYIYSLFTITKQWKTSQKNPELMNWTQAFNEILYFQKLTSPSKKKKKFITDNLENCMRWSNFQVCSPDKKEPNVNPFICSTLKANRLSTLMIRVNGKNLKFGDCMAHFDWRNNYEPFDHLATEYFRKRKKIKGTCDI